MKKSCTEFHKNLPKNLVAGSRSQRKKYGLHTRRNFILRKCVGFRSIQGLVRKFIGKHPNNMEMDIREAFIKLGCSWNWWWSCQMTDSFLALLKFHSLLWQNHLHNTGVRHTSVYRQETKSVDYRHTQSKTELCRLLLCELKCGPSLCMHRCWYYMFS